MGGGGKGWVEGKRRPTQMDPEKQDKEGGGGGGGGEVSRRKRGSPMVRDTEACLPPNLGGRGREEGWKGNEGSGEIGPDITKASSPPPYIPPRPFPVL